MAIKMNMFAGNQMTAANDGMIYDKMIAENGILNGCEMTFMGANKIHIAKGYLIIKGRLCTILEEIISVEMADADVELPGRLYIHADLADTITPVKFVSAVSDPLPDLIQDENFNFNNGIYELELATYSAGRVAIKDFTPTCGMIDDIGGVIKKIEEKIDQLNGNIMSGMVISRTVTTKYSIEANNGKHIDAPVPMISGYKPIVAIASGSDSWQSLVSGVSVSNTKVSAVLFNVGTSSFNDIAFSWTVLYVRNAS